MEIAVIFGGLVAVVVAWSNIASRRVMNDRLFELAKSLGGHLSSGNSVAGTYRHIQVNYRFVTRGSGSNAEQWTEVRAQLPGAYPLAIFIRRQAWLDRGRIERGQVVDVELSDAAFDSRFLVEAAPAAVIAKLLDAQARQFLMRQGEVTLETEDTDGKCLVLSLRGWIEDPPAAEHLVEELTRIVRRVREAFEATNTGTVEMTGSPFREMPVVREDPHAAERQRSEVQRLERKRASRFARERLTVFVFLAVVAFLVVLSIAAVH
ncbi:MAG: hypothetical protein ABJE66_11920 [Deltaproteobacteria bacterium]